ncbi:Uu.00g139680.m01.CDS01 [Anthostomella pinea]|uniref:Uu.00g139680.m01.CDS01 n=1 Tax=Anthostomella pinea TaxID=933095 RepID=A0AAI8YLA2_9PEZI|nr:Uu.00g139680.m01.CDS01 [Anthostomella pinea]
MPSSASSPVIIVGGGPVGLFTAHVLAAAKIDYILLERHQDIVRHRGALIIIWPPSLRLLDQLGLYERAREIGTRTHTRTTMTQDGQPIPVGSGRLWDVVEEHLGYPTLGFNRGDFIRLLYESLPERESRVRTSTEVVRIETRDDGVQVHLGDGSVIEGSLVIGADGVHSKTRELMQRMGSAQSATDGALPAGPMVTTYQSIFGRAPYTNQDIDKGNFVETHGPGMASQSMRTHDALYFSLIRRLPEPTSERGRFTDEDMEDMAGAFAEVEVFPGIKFKELWPARDQTNTQLLHQEEGLVDKWHHGRVVLVGDAIHKTTSLWGMGVNTGVNSVAVLANILRQTLRSTPTPSTQMLDKVFAEYQSARWKECAFVIARSKEVTRAVTWSTPEDEVIDRTIPPPFTMEDAARERVTPFLRQGQLLDFVPFDGKHGSVPWKIVGMSTARAML